MQSFYKFPAFQSLLHLNNQYTLFILLITSESHELEKKKSTLANNHSYKCTDVVFLFKYIDLESANNVQVH